MKPIMSAVLSSTPESEALHNRSVPCMQRLVNRTGANRDCEEKRDPGECEDVGQNLELDQNARLEKRTFKCARMHRATIGHRRELR